MNPKEFENWNKEQVLKNLENFDLWKQQGTKVNEIKTKYENVKLNLPTVRDFFKDLIQMDF